MPRPTTHRVALAALVAVVALALTACDAAGDPEPPPTSSTPTGSAAPEVAPDAVRTGLAALYAGDDATGAELRAEAECFADALLARLDADELRAAGIVQDDGSVPAVPPVLDVVTAREWVAAQGECADFVTVSTRAIVTQSKGRVDPEAYASCLREALTAEQVDAALVDTLTGRFDTEAVLALGEAQAGCSRSAQPPD